MGFWSKGFGDENKVFMSTITKSMEYLALDSNDTGKTSELDQK